MYLYSMKTIGYLLFSWFLLFLPFLGSSQHSLSQEVYVVTQKDSLFGTLLLPSGKIDTTQAVVLLIAGSGPTDRNGNNQAMVNNSLKMIADELSKLGIASLRYDKRGVAASSAAYIKEEDLRFQTNVDDAAYWLEVIVNFGYTNIVVAGHSEGALVGTLLAQQHPQVKKFISIAGAGRPIDVVLKEQYSKMNPTVRDSAYSIIDSLKKNVLVPHLSPWLFSVFRPSVQPYIISWMDLDPAAELAKLSIPILIIQGTTDLQVQMADAEALKSAVPTAQLAVLNEMNHVLKKVSNDKSENRNSYNNASLPLHPELIFQLYPFIKNP